jgi:hypothetical protein
MARLPSCTHHPHIVSPHLPPAGTCPGTHLLTTQPTPIHAATTTQLATRPPPPGAAAHHPAGAGGEGAVGAGVGAQRLLVFLQQHALAHHRGALHALRLAVAVQRHHLACRAVGGGGGGGPGGGGGWVEGKTGGGGGGPPPPPPPRRLLAGCEEATRGGEERGSLHPHLGGCRGSWAGTGRAGGAGCTGLASQPGRPCSRAALAPPTLNQDPEAVCRVSLGHQVVARPKPAKQLGRQKDSGGLQAEALPGLPAHRRWPADAACASRLKSATTRLPKGSGAAAQPTTGERLHCWAVNNMHTARRGRPPR